MEKAQFIYVVDRYLNGTATEAEKALLEKYYSVLGASGTADLSGEEEQLLKLAIYSRIQTNIHTPEKNKIARMIPFWVRIAAAVIVIVAGFWLFTKKNMVEKPVVQQMSPKDIAPGRNAAVLTLANGKQIILDSITGKLADENGVINVDGTLSYSSEENSGVQYHTLTTARGNQYKLVLPDGSKVFLNAATSLRYPSSFTGNAREVELNYGEAYLEIAKNKEKPFKVLVNNTDSSNQGAYPPLAGAPKRSAGGGGPTATPLRIDVLGTHFNITHYPEEGPVSTTLIDGSIKLSGNNQTKILVPGQQAIALENSFRISNPDLEKILAWTTGFFEFDKLDIRSVMRQISRWYDVDIVYENPPGDARFGGRISKNLPLSDVLKLLESNGVKFRLDGKKLYVK